MESQIQSPNTGNHLFLHGLLRYRSSGVLLDYGARTQSTWPTRTITYALILTTSFVLDPSLLWILPHSVPVTHSFVCCLEPDHNSTGCHLGYDIIQPQLDWFWFFRRLLCSTVSSACFWPSPRPLGPDSKSERSRCLISRSKVWGRNKQWDWYMAKFGGDKMKCKIRVESEGTEISQR